MHIADFAARFRESLPQLGAGIKAEMLVFFPLEPAE
jgi:hypothetical protein